MVCRENLQRSLVGHETPLVPSVLFRLLIFFIPVGRKKG